MKTTLFKAAISLIVNGDRSSVYRDELTELNNNYRAAYLAGDTEKLESSRVRIWEILIDNGALQAAYELK